MKKNKKGGMSQARFQRLRVGAIEHFLKEVADEMVKLFSKDNVVKIVITGPGNAKILLKDYLPNEVKNEILDVIDVDFDEADGYLISRAEEAVMKDEKETVLNNVIRLKEEILKHGLAVYGLKDTIEAVKNGYLELLLVSKGYKQEGWRCEKCQLVDSDKIDKCPNCSGNSILQELGGVGGLLRFKI